METDAVSETLCSLEYWTVDKSQKLFNPEFKCQLPQGAMARHMANKHFQLQVELLFLSIQ
jgi:hypothetical protein